MVPLIQIKHVTIIGFSAENDHHGFKASANKNMKRLVRDWKEDMLPKHFRSGAAAKYGYKKRSHKYRMKKLKKFGHTVPLLYEGGLRRLTGLPAQIKGGRMRATAVVTVPWYVKAGSRRRDGKGPNMEQELIQTTSDERKAMGDDIVARITEDLNNIKTRKRVKTS